MVKIKFNVNPKCQLEIDVKSPKEAFEMLAAFGEVFAETQCGLCKGPLKHEVRKIVGGGDYCSLRCLSCGAQLDFGQHRTGETLFCKKDKGWYHYKGPPKESEYA